MLRSNSKSRGSHRDIQPSHECWTAPSTVFLTTVPNARGHPSRSKDTVPTSLTSIRHCKFATASQWKRLRMCIDRQPVATTYMRYFSGVGVSLKVCSQHMNWTKLNSSNENVYSSGNVHSARTNWALIVPVSLQPVNFVTLMCVTSERAVM